MKPILTVILGLLLLGSPVIPTGSLTVPKEEYQARRQLYMDRFHDGVTIIFNSPDDQDASAVKKDFYYLTGFSEPGAILVLSPNSPEQKETLFVPLRNPDQERWTGPRLEAGSDAEKLLGMERVLTTNRFQSELARLCASERNIYTIIPTHPQEGNPSFEEAQVERLKKLFPYSQINNAGSQIASLRVQKSTAEIQLIRHAIEITLAGQRAAASVIADRRYEYEVEAAAEFEFLRRGAARPAYPSIVGSGPNSCILHYDKNRRMMNEGELVVVDAGAEYEEYAADITRTYPVGGKFTPRQREIYDIVLGAQEAALKQVKAGVQMGKGGPIHMAAFDFINSHGRDRQGNSLGRYFIHGTSHHLGLDVHDVVSQTNRTLEPGMVITIEPGVYIPEENLGIRIEDDVLVTKSGYELLSQDLPRKAEEIERLMQEEKNHPPISGGEKNK
ncbi:MAG: Xaa-Pro peptidase family protein [Terriglobia bacterium]